MAKGSYIGQVQIGDNTYPVGSILYGTASYDTTNNYWVVNNNNLTTTTFTNDNLTTGVTIHIKFNAINSADTPKLKVGNATEKAIVKYGTTNVGKSAATSWVANSIVSFTYDGTSWVMNTGIDSNDMRSAYTSTPAAVGSSGSAGSNAAYARGDHVHAISVAAGSNNGEITIAGQTIKPTNINNAAYKDVDTSISANSTSTKLPTSAAVAALIANSISDSFATADAMVFKGTLGTGGTITSVPTSGYSAGATYKIITAGTYAGITCEVGDMLIAIADATSGQSAVNTAHWTVVQTNIDGAVTGPTSSVDGNIALFNGTTGKIIKDSGIKFDGSTTNKWLTQKGTWTTPTASDVGAAASDHTQAVNKGGTNITSYTKGDILYASAATTLTKLGIGSANQVLKATTDGPAWSTPSVSVTANNSGSVVTGVGFNGGTQPTFTQGTKASASVSNGTLTLVNQGTDTFNKGTYPSLGTISKANLSISLS